MFELVLTLYFHLRRFLVLKQEAGRAPLVWSLVRPLLAASEAQDVLQVQAVLERPRSRTEKAEAGQQEGKDEKHCETELWYWGRRALYQWRCFDIQHQDCPPDLQRFVFLSCLSGSSGLHSSYIVHHLLLGNKSFTSSSKI